MNAVRAPRLLWMALVWLVACRPGGPNLPTPTPGPPPAPLAVDHTPPARPFREALRVCMEDQAGVALTVRERPARSLAPDSADLTVRLGAPADLSAFAAPLARERVTVIVHPENPLEVVEPEALNDLFSGRIAAWSDRFPDSPITAPVSVWAYPSGDEVRARFEGQILSPAERLTPMAQIAPDPAAMLAAVANDPGAIGYLPQAWLEEGVRAVSIRGDETDALALPLLAIAPEPISDAARNLLLCLQSGEGQRALMDRYSAWGE